MSEETYARLDSYAEDMSTCTLTNGDGIGYFYNRVDPDQPAGYTAVDMTTAFRDGVASMLPVLEMARSYVGFEGSDEELAQLDAAIIAAGGRVKE